MSQRSLKNRDMDLLDLLESDLSCAVCHEVFINPLILNCSHSFCKFCLYQWLASRKSDCPQCRVRVTSQAENLVLRNIITKLVQNSPPQFQQSRSVIVNQRLKEIEDLTKDVNMDDELKKFMKRRRIIENTDDDDDGSEEDNGGQDDEEFDENSDIHDHQFDVLSVFQGPDHQQDDEIMYDDDLSLLDVSESNDNSDDSSYVIDTDEDEPDITLDTIECYSSSSSSTWSSDSNSIQVEEEEQQIEDSSDASSRTSSEDEDEGEDTIQDEDVRRIRNDATLDLVEDEDDGELDSEVEAQDADNTEDGGHASSWIFNDEQNDVDDEEEELYFLHNNRRRRSHNNRSWHFSRSFSPIRFDRHMLDTSSSDDSTDEYDSEFVMEPDRYSSDSTIEYGTSDESSQSG